MESLSKAFEQKFKHPHHYYSELRHNFFRPTVASIKLDENILVKAVYKEPHTAESTELSRSNNDKNKKTLI